MGNKSIVRVGGVCAILVAVSIIVAMIIRGVADVPGLKELTDDAEPLYKRSLEIVEKALGPDHPSVVIVIENMVKLYKSMGGEEEAKNLEERAKAIRSSNK